MKLKDIFTAEELALIDSGEYKPSRAVLDAKLDLVAAIEREACAKVCEEHGKVWAERFLLGFQATLDDAADAIRARAEGQAFPTASHHLKLKQEHDGQAEFQRFVKSELGDIAVLDDDKFVSKKIKTYWRVWCASRGVKS